MKMIADAKADMFSKALAYIDMVQNLSIFSSSYNVLGFLVFIKATFLLYPILAYTQYRDQN